LILVPFKPIATRQFKIDLVLEQYRGLAEQIGNAAQNIVAVK